MNALQDMDEETESNQVLPEVEEIIRSTMANLMPSLEQNSATRAPMRATKHIKKQQSNIEESVDN